MASQIVSQGIGSPASIEYFLLLGLSVGEVVTPPEPSPFTITLAGSSVGAVGRSANSGRLIRKRGAGARISLSGSTD